MVQDIIEFIQNTQQIYLTPSQQEAVNATDTSVALVAVPGAGKTAVFTIRLANLIVNKNVSPDNILALTFSKAAAQDMERRYSKWFASLNMPMPKFSTIHSFARSLCMRFSPDFRNSTFIDGDGEGLKTKLIRKIYREVTGEYIDEDTFEAITGFIGYCKNMMILPNDTIKLNTDKVFSEVYMRYEKEKSKNNYIDYDDMLSIAVDLLAKPSVREFCEKTYTYIQIDEYQDTSKLQNEIIDRMVGDSTNLFVVGDDDQSIYKFRGACPEDFLNFENKYPGSKVLYMEDNFRSTKTIVDTSSAFIAQNKVRYKKSIKGNKDTGAEIDITEYATTEDQANQICSKIAEKKKNGALKPGTTAILFRNNISAVPFIHGLIKNNLTFYCSQLDLFFKNPVVCDITAYLKLSLGDRESLRQIYMKHYIPKVIMEEAIKRSGNIIDDVLDCLEGQASVYTIRNIRDMQWTINRLSQMPPVRAIKCIKDSLGYMEYIHKNNPEGSSYEVKARQIFDIMIALAENTKTTEEFIDFLNNFSEETGEETTKAYNADVVLKTIHTAKGAEWEEVYLIDLIDKIFPSNQALKGDREAYEEERRLFYVGMTRAKNLLHLSYPKTNSLYADKSVFLKELKNVKKPVKKPAPAVPVTTTGTPLFAEGEVLTHAVFGEGVVQSVNEKKDFLIIEFTSGELKKFQISFLKDHPKVLQ